jgi:hypothetical protein
MIFSQRGNYNAIKKKKLPFQELFFFLNIAKTYQAPGGSGAGTTFSTGFKDFRY